MTDYRIAPSGRLAFFLARGPKGDLSPITAVITPPVVSAHGVVKDVNPMVFGTPTSKVEPWIALQFKTPVLSTDDMTCGAPAGWAMTAAGPAQAIPDGTPMANYVGSLEPEFALPDKPTLKLGTNVGSITTAPYFPFSIAKNWRRRASGWKGQDVVQTLDGALQTFRPGTVCTSNICYIDTANGQDGRGTPNPVGKWEFVFNDANPGDPTVGGLVLSSNAATITPLPDKSRPGMLVDGVQKDVVLAYDVQYKPGASYWALWLMQTITQAKGINGARNVRIFSPGNSIDDADAGDPFAVDANLLNWLKLDSGKSPEWLRFMDSTLWYGGTSNAVHPEDLVSADDFTWNGRLRQSSPATVNPTGTRVLSIVEVRPYDLTVSPFVYDNRPTPNSSASPFGLPLPHRLLPPKPGWWNGGSPGWYAVEMMTKIDHDLMTGQTVTLGSGGDSAPPPDRIALTGGAATAMAPLYGASSKVYVTGPRSFLFLGYSSALTTGLSNTASVGLSAAKGDLRFPFNVYIDSPRQGTIPPQTCCAAVNKLPGGGYHLNVPMMFTPEATRWLAETVRDHFEPGHPLLVEVGNENWNMGCNGDYCAAMGNLQNPPLGQVGFAAWISIQAHQIFMDVFTAAGRGDDIVCGFGTQYGWPDRHTAGLVNYLNKYNTDNPTAPARLDALLTGAYVDVPHDAPFVAAWASVVPDNAGSSQHGTQWPWTLEMCHELMRYHVLYEANANDPVNGLHAKHRKYLAGFKLPANQAKPPIVIGYEGGVESIVPPGVDTAGSAIRNALTLDGFYHPSNKHTLNALFRSLDIGGYDALNYFSLSGPHYGASLWMLVAHALQRAGDGKANQFWLTDGKCHDLDNEAVALDAWKTWAALANDAPAVVPIPIPTPTPTPVPTPTPTPIPPPKPTILETFVKAGKLVVQNRSAKELIQALRDILGGQ